MMKKLWYKYYNKRILTRGNGNVQSHDQEESKLNITINGNSGAYTLTHDKIIKSPFNKNNAAIGFTCYLVSGDISICLPILTFSCLTHSPYWTGHI